MRPHPYRLWLLPVLTILFLASTQVAFANVGASTLAPQVNTAKAEWSVAAQSVESFSVVVANEVAVKPVTVLLGGTRILVYEPVDGTPVPNDFKTWKWSIPPSSN